MARLIVLGNCANQTAQYETTSFVIESERFRVLLDAGPGVVRQIYKAGLSLTDFDLVVITHSHGDHTLGFPYFIFSSIIERTQGKKGPSSVPVIALPEVYKGIMDMFSFCYPPGTIPNFKLENWEASGSESRTFQFRNTEITTVPVNHAVPTIGIRFEFDTTKIAFSSDTTYEKRMIELAKGCKVLVHEAFATSEMKEMAARAKHATAEEAGKAARDAGVQMLVLNHPLPIYIGKEDLVKEAAQYFHGRVLLPSDLETIEI